MSFLRNFARVYVLFMPNLILIGIFVLVVAILFIATTHMYYTKKRDRFIEEIRNIIPYYIGIHGEGADGYCGGKYNVSILNDFKRSFADVFVTYPMLESFSNVYREYYNKALELHKTLSLHSISPTKIITTFIHEYENIPTCTNSHNNRYVDALLEKHKVFFDTCLKYPLDAQQRRSIVTEEDNSLVVSSAGSGKTSSIVGKVKYLTEIKKVDPKKILLISYTNKAAAELTERMNTPGLRGYTFHKLAMDIIGRHTGAKPSICENADSDFIQIYYKLLEQPLFKHSVVEYFIDYELEESEEEKRRDFIRQELSNAKKRTIRAKFPDMDGKAIYVRSRQEKKICSVLTSLGVKFRYEEPYEYYVADESHSQYRPDFSIYYEKNGEIKRIYLEHFAIDEHENVPEWFAKEKGITHEEANREYCDGITWKRHTHKKYGTTLIETSCGDFNFSGIRQRVKKILKDAGVPIKELSNEELYSMVLPKGCKQEKAFIRLIVTFVTLVKSCCVPFDEILKRNLDERSFFIIKNIFYPVYKEYASLLADRNQIDFTDAILNATDICRNTNIVNYEHIIVDEFQDISLDRYNFLKVLREGNPPAKLYCVGDDWQSIYRFSGSDMALFNQFSKYFGYTEINKIETTYRFGEPLVSLSSKFIQRNTAQIKKNIHSFNPWMETNLEFLSYDRYSYCDSIEQLVRNIPADKSIFLLGRYSFDDYYLSSKYQSFKEGAQFYYFICGRKIEFLTAHKSKGLEADYVILLQCNKDTYGFPSQVSDDPVLKHVLTSCEDFPFAEERRLFYVAITRAKIKTFVLYDNKIPSIFVKEFLYPESVNDNYNDTPRNSNKIWTRGQDTLLYKLFSEDKSIKQIASIMGRSQTAIVYRLKHLGLKR